MTAFFKEIEPFRGNGNENEKGQTLENFLEEYDPYKYKNPYVTTDSSEHWLVGAAGWVY